MSRDPKRSTSLRRLVFVAALILALPRVALAENSVVIESRTFSPNQPNCSVGVALVNDEGVTVVVVVLELRSVVGDAYMAPIATFASQILEIQPESRLDSSTLGRHWQHYNCEAPTILTRVAENPDEDMCSGSLSHSWRDTVSSLSGTSPDGILFVTAVFDGCGPSRFDMPPGVDPEGRGEASLILRFGANANPGCFEVDTACFHPSQSTFVAHTGFGDYQGMPIPVSFTNATICIDPDCFHCYCQGDSYECDKGWIDIIDVVRAINVSFRGEAPTPDPSPVCPYMRTDINCDGATDLRDIVGIIDVAFNNQSEANAFCNPCP